MGATIYGKRGQLLFSAVWIRLPQLPTELYDGIILQKIENKNWKLLWINYFLIPLPFDSPLIFFYWSYYSFGDSNPRP